MTRSIAHPGIGLVYDGDRTIYYTDLTHIWKLDIENGEREIAVSDVHSHELCLDQDGNLYGEHYWYDADHQIFKNYLWKLSKRGVFSKIREEDKVHGKAGISVEFRQYLIFGYNR